MGDLQAPWNEPFCIDWLALPPLLANLDLRGALYVSREHSPLLSPEDRLSPEATKYLTGLLEHPDMANTGTMKIDLSQLPPAETAIMLQRLLTQARQEQEWGAPKILTACLAVADADAAQGPILAAFLRDLPPGQIQPSIVPKIHGRTWTPSVYEKWNKSDVSAPVKKAIATTLAKPK
jgi:predicted KAP-like P-loop ATPase